MSELIVSRQQQVLLLTLNRPAALCICRSHRRRLCRH
ncbi:hypothetical protein ACUOFC_17945, partial [Escherichia sp. TWPC-MK]